MNTIEAMNNKQEEIKQIAHSKFNTWNDSLQSGREEKVALLYEKKAIFLPTKSGDFKEGQIGAEEYFKHFLESRPFGEIVTGEDEVKAVSDDCFVHWGKYNFTVGEEDKRVTVPAEFTFVWKKNDKGGWEIIHHHSSAKNDEKKSELENGFRPEVKLPGEPKPGSEEEFFGKYFSDNNIGAISEKENKAQKLSDDSYLHSGMYNTEEGDNARFTITWKKSGEEWEIIQHHLSMRPESK